MSLPAYNQGLEKKKYDCNLQSGLRHHGFLYHRGAPAVIDRIALQYQGSRCGHDSD